MQQIPSLNSVKHLCKCANGISIAMSISCLEFRWLRSHYSHIRMIRKFRCAHVEWFLFKKTCHSYPGFVTLPLGMSVVPGVMWSYRETPSMTQSSCRIQLGYVSIKGVLKNNTYRVWESKPLGPWGLLCEISLIQMAWLFQLKTSQDHVNMRALTLSVATTVPKDVHWAPVRSQGCTVLKNDLILKTEILALLALFNLYRNATFSVRRSPSGLFSRKNTRKMSAGTLLCRLRLANHLFHQN